MLNFYLKPKLEYLTLSRLSGDLWKQPDIVSEIKHLHYSPPGTRELQINSIKWAEVRKKVLHKLTFLHFPHLLKDKAEDFVEQIGRQIRLWIKNNKQFLPQVDMVNFLRLLKWNSLGGIDEKKTAELILETKDGLSLEQCYILACNNCLEDKIRLLWKLCPLHKRKSIFSVFSNDFINPLRYLVQYWSYYNEGALDSLDNLLIRYNSRRTRCNSLNEFYVYWSLRYSNNVAFQYFWQKLSEEEKLPISSAIMSKTLKECRYSFNDVRRDIFYFLATRMKENQLKELLERNPASILYFWFKEGVGQNRFLFTFDDTVWNLCPSSDSCAILIDAAEFTLYHVLSKCFGNRSQLLFRNLWKNTPSHIKRSLFKEWNFIWNFLCFMFISDTETLQLIYDDATAEEKARINNFFSHNLEDEFLTTIQYWRSKTIANNETAVFSEKEVHDFVKESLKSIYSEQRKDERWPLLETLDKWKEKHVAELILSDHLKHFFYFDT